MEDALQKIEQKKHWNALRMKINSAYKYELKPNVAQRIHLAKHAGVARFAFNWGLAKRIELYEKDKKTTNAIEQHRLLNSLIQGVAIGIDVGLTSFATLSDGNKIMAPKPLAKNLKQLRKISKKHSRKVLGSNNRKKSALKLSRLHRRVRNNRKDFLHKETTLLAKTKSVIVLEDLNVKEMLSKKRLSRQISDVGWSEFRCMLEYKTKWYGSTLIVAPRFYPSSKICSECGILTKELPLEIRQWQCAECHNMHDRDVNAAKNLLKWSTGSSPGINACGDTSYGASKKTCSYVSLKQEVMNGIFVHKL